MQLYEFCGVTKVVPLRALRSFAIEEVSRNKLGHRAAKFATPLDAIAARHAVRWRFAPPATAGLGFVRLRAPPRQAPRAHANVSAQVAAFAKKLALKEDARALTERLAHNALLALLLAAEDAR